MKKIYFFTVAFIGFSAFAQNLVPNPSFEILTDCPTASSQLYASNWVSAGQSPDLYNVCSPFPMSVPTSYTGIQVPVHGDGYAGLFTNTSSHEYIQAMLTSPLIAGQTYTVTFYVSLGDNFQTATNNLGALLSSVPVTRGANGIISQVPQVNYSSVITDTENWTQVSGSFQAQGGENYITIGNFYTNQNTAIQYISPDPWGLYRAYYFIDMVSVVSGNLSIQNNHYEAINIFPNPTKDIAYLDNYEVGQGAQMSIFNSLGQMVKFTQYPFDKIDLTGLETGTYVVVIFDGNKKIMKRITKI